MLICGGPVVALALVSYNWGDGQEYGPVEVLPCNKVGMKLSTVLFELALPYDEAILKSASKIREDGTWFLELAKPGIGRFFTRQYYTYIVFSSDDRVLHVESFACYRTNRIRACCDAGQ